MVEYSSEDHYHNGRLENILVLLRFNYLGAVYKKMEVVNASRNESESPMLQGYAQIKLFFPLQMPLKCSKK